METKVTVKDFVMLLMSTQMYYIRKRNWFKGSIEEAYEKTLPIPRIYLNDGTSFSAQCHPGVHCKFEDVPCDVINYSTSFGRNLLKVETDIPEDDTIWQYCSEDMELIEAYAEKHGGIDFAKTTERAINCVFK